MIRNGWRVFGGGVVAFGGLRLFVECKDGGNKAESVGGGGGGGGLQGHQQKTGINWAGRWRIC